MLSLVAENFQQAEQAASPPNLLVRHVQPYKTDNPHQSQAGKHAQRLDSGEGRWGLETLRASFAGSLEGALSMDGMDTKTLVPALEG